MLSPRCPRWRRRSGARAAARQGAVDRERNQRVVLGQVAHRNVRGRRGVFGSLKSAGDRTAVQVAVRPERIGPRAGPDVGESVSAAGCPRRAWRCCCGRTSRRSRRAPAARRWSIRAADAEVGRARVDRHRQFDRVAEAERAGPRLLAAFLRVLEGRAHIERVGEAVDEAEVGDASVSAADRTALATVL